MLCNRLRAYLARKEGKIVKAIIQITIDHEKGIDVYKLMEKIDTTINELAEEYTGVFDGALKIKVETYTKLPL